MPYAEFIYGPDKSAALRLLLEDATEIVVVSAFTTSRGLSEIREAILRCASRNGRSALLLGIDRRGIASSQLIRDLADLLQEAGSGLRVFLLVETGASFLHAKIYAARKKQHSEVLVGSINLTGSGLTTNHEFAVRLTSDTSSFFQEINQFISSLPEVKELTAENAEDVIQALERSPSSGVSSAANTERRIKAQRRLEEILQAVQQTSFTSTDQDSASSQLRLLLDSGNFWTYQFDLKKLTIPSGISGIYDKGLLPREQSSEAGTAKIKIPKAISASFPLVPPARQRQFSSLAKRLGRAFRSNGFETPYGYWIPNAYQTRLQEKVTAISQNINIDEKTENEIREFINSHVKNLETTAKAISQRAAKDGIQHPTRWRNIQNPQLSSLRDEWKERSQEDWDNSSEQNLVLAYIRDTILTIQKKLDADFALAKLKRIRPEMLSVDMNRSELASKRLLDSLTWGVLEDTSEKNTKHAVRDLKSRLSADCTSAMLRTLSDLLREGAEGAERLFFTFFGSPPYWSDHVTEQDTTDGEDSELSEEEDSDADADF